MNETVEQIFEIIRFVFLAPILLVVTLIYLIKHFVFKMKVDNSNKSYGAKAYLFSLLVWCAIAGGILYNNQFKPIYYNFACQLDNSVVCYEFRTDYDSEGIPTRIIFPDGDYIEFEYCDYAVKQKVRCYAEEDNNVWDLTYSKTVKILKQN